MATTATWWSELTKQASAAPRCRNTGARWFNTDNCRYYCDSCARGINQACAEQRRSATCSLRV